MIVALLTVTILALYVVALWYADMPNVRHIMQ